MTVWREQLWMVKRRRLGHRAWVRQSIAQEVHQVSLFLHGEPQHLNIRIHVLNFSNRIEVTATVVELNHLLKRQLAAVVEIRRGQRDVAQLRRLEEAATGNVIIAIHRRRSNAIAAPAGDDHSFVTAVTNVLAQYLRLRKRKARYRIVARSEE